VQINEQGRIVAFTEKNQLSGEGLINGGIYLIDKEWFQSLGLPAKFSFEKEVLESVYEKAEFYGLDFQSYFIDIGVPEDYARAQIEFKTL
jgi:D-glycero-alpha-D-manno-heptose 1-phosphate guanylyltransferase